MRVVVYKDNDEVGFSNFDSENVDNNSWFSKKNLAPSSWSDLYSKTKPMRKFSIQGNSKRSLRLAAIMAAVPGTLVG